MEFDYVAHHDFVQRHGTALSYYRGLPCPCGSTVDGARSRFVCPLCKGTGTRYEAATLTGGTPPFGEAPFGEPGAATPLVGIITGIAREKMLLEAGIAQPGDAVLGLSPLETQMVTDWDMVEPSSWAQGQPYSGELVTRSVGATDTLVYKAKQIVNCSSVHPTTFAVTNYTAGTHFTVAGDVVTWLVGQPQPAAGMIYSIKYTAVFAYVVFTIPQDRYDASINIGQRVLVRPRHLAIQKRTP